MFAELCLTDPGLGFAGIKLCGFCAYAQTSLCFELVEFAEGPCAAAALVVAFCAGWARGGRDTSSGGFAIGDVDGEDVLAFFLEIEADDLL